MLGMYVTNDRVRVFHCPLNSVHCTELASYADATQCHACRAGRPARQKNGTPHTSLPDRTWRPVLL